MINLVRLAPNTDMLLHVPVQYRQCNGLLLSRRVARYMHQSSIRSIEKISDDQRIVGVHVNIFETIFKMFKNYFLKP